MKEAILKILKNSSISEKEKKRIKIYFDQKKRKEVKYTITSDFFCYEMNLSIIEEDKKDDNTIILINETDENQNFIYLKENKDEYTLFIFIK